MRFAVAVQALDIEVSDGIAVLCDPLSGLDPDEMLNAGEFDRWLQKAKASKDELTRDAYLELEKPSEREPVRRYRAVALDLFDAVVNRCVDQGKMCMREMMAMDAHRSSGRQSAREAIALNLGFDAVVCRADNSTAGALLPSVYRD